MVVPCMQGGVQQGSAVQRLQRALAAALQLDAAMPEHPSDHPLQQGPWPDWSSKYTAGGRAVVASSETSWGASKDAAPDKVVLARAVGAADAELSWRMEALRDAANGVACADAAMLQIMQLAHTMLREVVRLQLACPFISTCSEVPKVVKQPCAREPDDTLAFLVQNTEGHWVQLT
jgi:hypothetical protein